MTTYNTLSVYGTSTNYGIYSLNEFIPNAYFLYKNSIDFITYCADSSLYPSTVKVYAIFEDLL